MANTHPWRSKGAKATIWWPYNPPQEIVQYLYDMRNAINYTIHVANDIRMKEGKIPTPIDVRKVVKPWFDSNYDYAKHHVNPVCKTAIAILRSFRKNRRSKEYPEASKLAMRIDSELFRLLGDVLRVTLKPGQYVYVPVNNANKHYYRYSSGKISELLITDSIVALSFRIEGKKHLAKKKMGIDLNFTNIVGTIVEDGTITGIVEKSTRQIVKIQNDFTRRRKSIQTHVKNPQKRKEKLRNTRGRQKNRVKDALHKVSLEMVKEFPDTSFILEDLKHVRKSSKNGDRRYRTYLNMWPYSEFQRMLEYKSRTKTIKVDPRGTSSECPVCGERIKHPTWKISRCNNCDRDYDRDRLASLAISLRGLNLCGEPFPVSALASTSSVMDEYLHNKNQPEVLEVSLTEKKYAANKMNRDVRS